MAKILLRKRLDGSMYAMDDEAESVLKRIKAGKDCWCEVRMARNPRQHRLYFGLLALTYQNLPEKYAAIYRTPEAFRRAVQIEAGHVDELIGIDGAVYRIPRSIAWDSLEQLEFEVLFPQVMSVCAAILRMDSSELAVELERHAA